MNSKTIIKTSQIEGIGLFTESHLVKGDIIENVYSLSSNHKSKYGFSVPFKFLLESFPHLTKKEVISKRNLYCIIPMNFKYLNHSNNPNMKLIEFLDSGVMRMKVLRDVKENTELTIDYNTEESKIWN